MMEEELRLKLVGYYPSASHGFMMPLFGSGPGANTLFLAKCSGTGGRYGKVTAFEPVEVDNQRRIPLDDVIDVEIGQEWRDVFLWNEAVFVGTPVQLWSELSSFHADLEIRAPLSLIELAVQAGRPEVARLAPAAMNFLTERFGASQAHGWRRQFLRLHLELALRKNLAGPKLTAAEFRHVSLIEETSELRLEIPSSLAAALQTSVKGKEAIEQLVGLAAMLGKTLVVAASLGSTEDQGSEAASVAPEPPTDGSTSSPEQFDVPPLAPGSERFASQDLRGVAVWALGKRATAVTGHLRSARNRDTWPGDDRLRLLSERDVLTGERIYSEILVVIIDDDYLEDGSLHPDIEEFLADQISEGTLVLIAPSLPPDGPSKLLEARQGHQFVEPSIAHAIVDTAIARSPFWWGQTKRSFDRRITDVVQLAITAGGNTALRRELMQRLPADVLPILSVGLLPEKPGSNDLIDGPGNLRLGSESSWVDGNPKRNDPDILFSIRMSSDGREREPHDERLIAEGRQPTDRFPEFATRSLTTLSRKGRRSGGSQSLSRVEQLATPAELDHLIKAPSRSAAFLIQREIPEDRELRLLVTAETPDLNLIESINSLGWSVVRYTDTTSVRRLVEKGPAAGSFPDEVDIGPIRSAETHRRLATRGLDQRDVVRVSADLVAEAFRSLSPAERAIGTDEARLRCSASASTSDSMQDYLFRADFLQTDLRAAESLRDVLSVSLNTRGAQRQTRRQADMQRCWSPPAEGLSRYAVVDGSVPPILVRLKENEAPVEDFFIIDGDSAVPVLFRSRAFAVWARATLPAASSWMARFSLIHTFGGFPLVQPFLLDMDVQGRTILKLEGQPSSIIELAAAVEGHIERAASLEVLSSWKEAHVAAYDLPAMQRLDEIVLNAYGLPGNASDTNILRRLLALNGQLD